MYPPPKNSIPYVPDVVTGPRLWRAFEAAPAGIPEPSEPATKPCSVCLQPFGRRDNESFAHFNLRPTCSSVCTTIWTHTLDDLGWPVRAREPDE